MNLTTCVALHPYYYRLVNPEASILAVKNAESEMDVDGVEDKFAFPRFEPLVAYFFAAHHTLPASFGEAGNLIAGKLPAKSFAAALAFAKRIAIWESLGTQQLDIKIDEDWDRNVDAVIDTDESARAKVEAFLAKQEASVTTLLDVAWEGMVYDGEGVDHVRSVWNELAVLVPQSIMQRYSPRLTDVWKLLNTPRGETRRVAAFAVGILGSHEALGEALAGLVEDLVLGVEQGRNGAFLALGILLSRLKLRGRLEKVDSGLVTKGVQGIATALAESRDGVLVETAIEAVGELAVFGVVAEDRFAVDKVQKALLEKAKRGHEKAMQALGYLSFLYPEGSNEAEIILEELIKVGEGGGVEMSFVAGEALANVSAGWGSSAVRRGRRIAGVEWTAGRRNGVKSLLDRFLKRAGEAGGGGKRRTTVVGLLSVFEFCSGDDATKERLGDAQQAFRNFLTDRDGASFLTRTMGDMADDDGLHRLYPGNRSPRVDRRL